MGIQRRTSKRKERGFNPTISHRKANLRQTVVVFVESSSQSANSKQETGSGAMMTKRLKADRARLRVLF